MKMIGFYDYTVILTYLSLMSGATGIMLCLNGIGHPYLGMFFLLFQDYVIPSTVRLPAPKRTALNK